MIPYEQITERKIKANGSVHEYLCDLVYASDELLVIAYVMKRGGTLPGIGLTVLPGSVSYGYFWCDRPYNLYRMKRPDGSIIAHRIDAVTGVEWTTTVLEYRDVVLDWWLPASGGLVAEDEDELAEAIAAGLLSEADIAAAEAARLAVEGSWQGIIAEAEAFEAAHLAPTGRPLHAGQESP